MLTTPITLDYAGNAIILDRINQDNYGATYFAREGSLEYLLEVKHTIPKRGETGESHLVKLSVSHHDAEGAYVRTSSAWTVIKTFDGVQDDSAGLTAESLMGFLGQPNVMTKVTSRQS